MALRAEIPALLRKGALDALGDPLDFEKDALSPTRHGVMAPLQVNEAGDYILSVVEFGTGPPRSDRRPSLAASYFEWSFSEERPDLSDGGLHLPHVESGHLRFVPPIEFSASTAATSGDARDDGSSDPEKINLKLRVNWGLASANQLKRVLVDSDGGMSHLANYAVGVLGNCDVCRAFEEAPHVPTAGASAVPMFNEKAQVDLAFLGDLIRAHAMDVFPKYSLLPPANSKNPQEVWDVFCGGRLGAFGIPRRIQTD